MAKTVETEEERLERINLVANYIIDNKASVRKTSEYFSENYFPISIATISDYCQRFMKLYPSRAEELKEVIDKNKPKTIKDDEVLLRIKRNYNLFIEGKTIDEIAALTEVDYWIIYRDLTERLPRISKDIFEKDVKPVLEARSRKNLNNGKSK